MCSYLDSAAFVKAKINNAGILGLGMLAFPFFLLLASDLMSVCYHKGYTQALRPGVRASFGLALDTNRLNEVAPLGPAHRFGASITFEG